MAGQVRALTAVGREMEADVGTPQGALLKWVVMHPQLAVVRRNTNKAVYLYVAYSIARRLWPRLRLMMYAKAQGANGIPSGMPSGEDLGPAGVPAAMMPKMTSLLASEDGSIMWKEMLCSGVVAGLTSMLMIRKAFLLGRLIDLQNSPSNRAEWRWYAWQFPLNALSVTFLQELSSYISRRTVLKWRRNVTRKVHDLYFNSMGYYRLHNRGREMAVEDPDIRICNDIKGMCESNAAIAFSLCNALVFTAAFGQAVIQGRNWKWSLLTPAFYGAALYCIIGSEPVERYTLQFEMANVESKYSQLITRMQLHAERICMLQGEKFETSMLAEQIGKIFELGKRLRYMLFRRDLIENIIFNGQGPPAFIEQMGWLMGSTMVANDVLAGAAAEGNSAHLPLDKNTPYHHSSGALGTAINNLWAWFNTCNSWGTVTTAYFSVQAAEAGNIRVQELYGSLVVLKTLASKENARVFLDQGPVISFDGVCVRTPTGQQLLQDLSFKVDEGQMLLVCGHNGAGKSSIIRCLCALWPVPKGKITRPGGAASAEDNVHLHNEMYYLPQKPCNVLGTLSDQLTYPEKCELPDKELRRWLRYVDLEYLADRKIGADAVSRVKSSVLSSAQEAVDHVEDTKGNEIDWEVLLSLGEQQALSIARLLYHRPRFAILDECTSAVGKVLERRLFEIAREIGISCISITHRPALKDHHERMLMLTGRLAEDGRGWELTDIPNTAGHRPVRERPEDMAEVHSRIEACIASGAGGSASAATDRELEEQRSKEYLKQAQEDKAVSAEAHVKRTWPSSISRFLEVLRLGLKRPGLQQRAALKGALMLCILRLRLSFVWMMWRGLLGMVSAAICGDKMLVFTELGANICTSFVFAILDQWFRLEVQDFTDELWRSVTLELQERMLRGISFMKVMNPPGSHIPTIENPMQRLTEPKKLFGNVCNQVISVAIPMSQALWLLPTMFRGVGLWAPFLLGMNYVAFRTAQLFSPDFAKIQSVQATLESRFQVLHTRLKAISEPVAFSGAGAAERRIIEPRFDAVIGYELEALGRQFLYNMVVTYFTDYGQLPIWTHRLMAIRYVTYNNPSDPRGLTPANVTSNVLFDRSTQFTQVWVQRCVMFMPEWRRIDAYCNRILEMVIAFDLAAEEVPGDDAREPASDEGKISVRGLDVVTKPGRCLAKGLSFDVVEGQPILVTGPNATGKSLLGCVLLGLWAPAGKDAKISIPGATGPRPPLKTIMPAPQRIYLPVGVLYIQLMYPFVPNHDEIHVWPFKIVCYDLPEGVTSTQLFMHFLPLGATGCYWAQDEATGKEKDYAFVTFDSLDAMYYSAARPQDRVLQHAGEERQFKVDFHWAVPDKPSDIAGLVRMRECLRAVGIEHVLLRESYGWVTDRSWEDVLSGGEQQRLCFARVLVHKPKFALLDECTSMVAADAEADLYRKLFQDYGITPLTLTQRPFMHDLYGKDLSLGARTAGGWELSELGEASPKSP